MCIQSVCGPLAASTLLYLTTSPSAFEGRKRTDAEEEEKQMGLGLALSV